jgi:RND family efflux transporter MFP subunit
MHRERKVEDGSMMIGRWSAGALALLLAGAAAGCGNVEAGGTRGDADEAFIRVINVEVTEVSRENFVEEIRLTAAVQANRDVEVAAEESGVIREILADRGTPVQEGQPVAKIDDAILRAQVEQARAQAELAAQTWERRKRLWEEDRVGSEIAYLEAKFAQEQTAANLRALEERLARTTIRAPFGGVLDERRIEVGSMVGPGTVVGRIVDLNPLKVLAGVPERYAADVRPGARAQITFDVLPGQVLEGTVGYVGAAVDPQSRTFPIEIAVRNARGVIKPQIRRRGGIRGGRGCGSSRGAGTVAPEPGGAGVRCGGGRDAHRRRPEVRGRRRSGQRGGRAGLTHPFGRGGDRGDR